MRIESVGGLRLLFVGQEVGILTHYSGGKNIVVFSPDYIALAKTARNTELPMHGAQQKIMKTHWQNLHPDFRIELT